MLHYINIQIQLFFFRNQNKTGRKQKELEIFRNTMEKDYNARSISPLCIFKYFQCVLLFPTFVMIFDEK